MNVSDITKVLSVRKTKKITLRLPEDQIAFLDYCAKVMGISRNYLFVLIIDTFANDILNFVRGWVRAEAALYRLKQEFEEAIRKQGRGGQEPSESS